MLGRDIVLAAGNAGHDVVGFGHTELDVADAGALGAKFELERPDVVINCAAWTDVDGAEDPSRRRWRSTAPPPATSPPPPPRSAPASSTSPATTSSTAQGRALRRNRPNRAALRLRAHQARRRGSHRGGQQAPLRRPLLLALRHRRLQLRRDDAAPRLDSERGPGRARPGRLAHLHLAPCLRHRPPDRGSRVRHPPHGRRRRLLLVRLRPRDLRAGQGRVPGPLRYDRRCSAAPHHARLLGPRAASANTRSSCRLGRTASPPTLPSAPPSREAAA